MQRLRKGPSQGYLPRKRVATIKLTALIPKRNHTPDTQLTNFRRDGRVFRDEGGTAINLFTCDPSPPTKEPYSAAIAARSSGSSVEASWISSAVGLIRNHA